MYLVFFGGILFLGLDLTGVCSVMDGVVLVGRRVATMAPDVVGLTVLLYGSVVTSVSGAGRCRGWEVVRTGLPGVENAMGRTDVLMEAVVVITGVDVSGGGVE